MSIFRHGSCLCSTPVDIWNMMIQQSTATCVNHSFHKRNKNGFFTWVTLDIFLLWSVNHSFHNRNKNGFFKWVSLGIFLLWSVNHSIHKRNENYFFTWVSLGIFLLFIVKLTKIVVQKLGLNFWDIRLGLEKNPARKNSIEKHWNIFFWLVKSIEIFFSDLWKVLKFFFLTCEKHRKIFFLIGKMVKNWKVI